MATWEALRQELFTIDADVHLYINELADGGLTDGEEEWLRTRIDQLTARAKRIGHQMWAMDDDGEVC